MMLDAQVRDVRDLTRRAGISALTTRVRVGDPLLTTIAPGERTFSPASARAAVAAADARGGGARTPRRNQRRGGLDRTPARATSTRGGNPRGRPSSKPARSSGGHSAAAFSSSRVR